MVSRTLFSNPAAQGYRRMITGNAACGVFGLGLKRWPELELFLGRPVKYAPLMDSQGLGATASWGLANSERAKEVAHANRIPFLALEAGFLSSGESGKRDSALSIVVDDLGMYFDCSSPSRLEQFVSRDLRPIETARAQSLIVAWREGRVSRFNSAREYSRQLPERFVLAVDQTAEADSIRFGGACAASFQQMLASALSENPDCAVVVLPRADDALPTGRWQVTCESAARNPRVIFVESDVHPAGLIKAAAAVYVVTSHLGFEGLLWGKPVRTFGMPFYAGWGLTQDALPPPERRKRCALENLVHSALIDYSRYIHPETGERCEVEQLLAWLSLQRQMRERFSASVTGVGFTFVKKPVIRSFFQGSKVTFVRRFEKVENGTAVASWGSRQTLTPSRVAASYVQLEDGFLRSVGLGADLIRPVSLVMDRRGIYYDSRQPSDLEQLLQTTEFTAALLDRAGRLRERILAGGITKYNVGTGTWERPAGPKRNILVPGQVESDASLRFGAPGTNTCIGLLRGVRQAHPDAHVIYKPHPDVVAGLRPAGRGEKDAAEWCDELLVDLPMGHLLPLVDEVHTLTSLTGFEALLRGRKVTCYGQPFFAGWGLTSDIAPVARRSRRLTLDELVAGTLILYPTYISRKTGKFTTPERVLDELTMWRRSTEAPSVSRRVANWLRRLKAKVLRRPSTVFGIPRQ